MYDWLMDMIISFLEMLIPGDSSNNYEEWKQWKQKKQASGLAR